MNKTQLIKEVSNYAEVSQSITKKILEAFIDKVKGNLLNKESIDIQKFGTFTIIEKQSRNNYNPFYKTTTVIPKLITIKFKPSKHLKSELNNK